MKIYYKMSSISLILTLLLIAMMAVPPISNAAQATVGMGTTSSFAVLAGSTITNTGPSTIDGSIGLHPGTAFTGAASATVSGEIHINDAEALLAKDDLITAYNDAAGRQNVTTIASELGGTTLTPGTYNSADGTFHITGKLTLDGQGDPNAVFIFQTASSLITESGSNINLINSTRYCQVFWQVGSSATLGTNSNFKGNILAMESITATTGAKIEGKLFARVGAVTLDSNTITNTNCTVTTPVETTPNVTVTAETTTNAPVTKTVTGGQLPKTSTSLYKFFAIGAGFILLGAIGWRNRKQYE